MQKVGSAESTEFVISIRPAWLRKVEVAASLLSHLVTKGEKSMIFGLVRLKGRPRYVNGKLPVS